MKIVNKQSAFSLIEVLISLVILSFAVMGTGKLLVDNRAGYSVLQQQADAWMITSAIVESLSVDRGGVLSASIMQDWQQKLDIVLPGSLLMIEHQQFEEQCVYTVTLSFASRRQKTLTLKVVV